MADPESRLKQLEEEIERRLVERFAALRDEFDRLRLESDRRWAGFLDRFEQKFTGIVPPELMSAAEPAPAPAPAAGTVEVEAARAFDDASNQVEALHRFLDSCRRYASRAALLVTRGGSVGVWKSVGFSEHGGNDETTRRAKPPSAPESLLARVMEGHGCELPKDNDISASLSAGEVTRAVLIPMVVKEKISGALYADCVEAEASRFDPEALGFLTFLAGLIVDRLAGRKLKPAPALGVLQVASSAAPAAASTPATPSAPPEPEFELAEEPGVSQTESSGAQMMRSPETPIPAPPPPKIPPPPQFYGLPPEEEPRRPTAPPFERFSRGAEEATPSADVRPLELASEPEEPPVPGGTVRIPTSMIEAAAAAPPRPEPRPAPPMPPPPAPAAPTRRPSTGARRLAGPLAPVEGDERRDEARRFAKLLVSEIKLYNEKAVQQGRSQGNIYELLKEDIDRSRQMYDERIPEDVRASSNFFYDELVRVLADGRADALGL